MFGKKPEVVYVTKKKTFGCLTYFVLAGLVSLGYCVVKIDNWATSDAPESNSGFDASKVSKATAIAMNNKLESGEITKVDMASNTIFVNHLLWAEWPQDQKMRFTAWASLYFDSQQGKDGATIKSNLTDDVLATVSALFGVSIKE